jgi:hypothetical protein
MANGQLKHAIGTFSNRQSAEQALKELRDTGFPINKISVIAKNSDRDKQLGSDDTSERTVTRAEGVGLGAAVGAAIGGLPALVGSLGVLFVPGVGPVLAAESILAALLGSGAIAATGGLIGALQGWFIPEEQARFYNDRVSQGDCLVTVESTEDDIRRAEPVLRRWGVQEWRIYNAF